MIILIVVILLIILIMSLFPSGRLLGLDLLSILIISVMIFTSYGLIVGIKDKVITILYYSFISYCIIAFIKRMVI